MEALSSPQVVKDIRYAVDHDSWMWVVVWGPPRSGKSTLCLDIAYQIYGDWDKVLGSVVFNLSQLIYNIKKGLPERWPTLNLLHDRVPLLIWDDFGAYSNKAITQHDQAWDTFKGAFDTLGTKVAVILANMVSPGAPTQQLQIKFTHELWVYARGKCKYDEVNAQQDYRGWDARSKKTWLQDFDFPEVPKTEFQQYDDMRMSLADEILLKVEDQIVDTHLASLMRKVNPLDVQLLRLIELKGPVYKQQIVEELGEEQARNVIIRTKARQLINPIRVGVNYYRYDYTDLGVQLLRAIEQKEEKETKVSTFSI